MLDKKAISLGSAIKAANTKLMAHLQKTYPRGSRVGVMLKAGQSAPSIGTVVGHDTSVYGGDLRVRLDKAKQRTRYAVRSIGIQSVEIVYQRPASAAIGEAMVKDAEQRFWGD